MSHNDPESPVLTHTLFKSALNIDITDLDSGFRNRLPLFMGLNHLLAAPGRRRSLWSRIKEHPERVLLVTYWSSHHALADFEASEGYATYTAGLTSAANKDSDNSVPSVTRIGVEDWQIAYRLDDCWVAITSVYFPHPTSATQKSAWRDLRPVAENVAYGPSLMHRSPSVGYPIKGLAEGEREWEGKMCEVGVVWHFWVDREMEERFKGSASELGQEGEERMVVRFEREMREMGVVGWVEEHCVFDGLPGQACGL